jgi:aspartate/methionine/tyrosine aminotransferase
MPEFPTFSPSVTAMGGSVYSALAHRLATHAGEVYPLHVGDTWMEPAIGCRMEDLPVSANPGVHKYASPHGLPTLLDRLCDRANSRMNVPTAPANALVTAGATGGLTGVVGALLSPGDDVLIVAPFWPLIAGMVRCFHGNPIPVPFHEIDGPEAALEALNDALTPRAVAVYISSPNNPTGRLLPPSWLAAIADWARTHDLWIISDEVYEDYVYTGEHAYMRSLAPERTFSAHSFSKAYGMAGNRVGYVFGPANAMAQVQKVTTHAYYCSPRASQVQAAKVLVVGDRWLASAHQKYAELGRYAAQKLGTPPPEGGTFVFLDVSSALDDDGLMGFLGRCADRGLLLAPGTSFGPYPTHVRVCFTSAPPDVVKRGVGLLSDLLGGV